MPLPKNLPSTKTSSDRPKEFLANRYEVQRTLGSGNCGTALLALDLKERNEKEKLKVVKKIFVGALQPDETVDAASEAGLLRSLNCSGIVKFYDSFVELDFFCIVTEYCEGGDLDSRITEHKKHGKPFPESQVVEWVIELLLALQYMHSRKILHRDLKTRNIFLKNDRVKIGDFGISRILMGSSDMASTFVGTPYYMSPEVLKHEGYNSKSDVWSVGCILYDLVALEHPFQGTTLMGVMYKITEGPPPTWPEDYSADLEDLFLRTLEKDPVRRPSASEALRMPFVVKQFELMKNTLLEKHQAREQNDVISHDTELIASAFRTRGKLGELRKESDMKRYRNLPPRERYRREKQIKADEAGRKLQAQGLEQLRENEARRQEISRKNNPYESTLQIGGRTSKRVEEPPKRTPYTYPGILRREISSSDDSDGREGDRSPTALPPRRPSSDDERPISPMKGQHNLPGGRQKQRSMDDGRTANHNQRRPEEAWSTNARPGHGRSGHGRSDSDSEDERSRTMVDPRGAGRREPEGGRAPLRRTISHEDRPITPMKNRMVYNMHQSSLDFEDGIPEQPELANTYYSQYDNEFDDDSEGEVNAMVTNLQSFLDLDRTLGEQTLVMDDKLAGAFGPGARDIKIKNLRAEAERKLGREKFARVYDYLKRVRFTERRTSDGRLVDIDEKHIMADLKRITPSSDDCYLVEQLLFLEVQE